MKTITFNGLCKQARVESGYIAKEVAIDCGCTVNNVYMFEAGKSCSGKLITWYLNNTRLASLLQEEMLYE